MSIAFQYVAEKSNMLSPVLGDFGFFGRIPSLRHIKEYQGRWLEACSFGLLYAGLERLGIHEYQLDNFHAYLELNQSDSIRVLTDHDDEESVAFAANNTFVGFPLLPEDNYVFCSYTIENLALEKSYAYSNNNKLNKLIPNALTLSTVAIAALLDELKDVNFYAEIYNLFGIVDAQEYKNIFGFIKENQEYTLTIRVEKI